MVNVVAIIYTVFFTIVGATALVIGYNIWKGQFTHKFRIRRLTATSTKVTRDALAKIKYDKQRIPYLSIYFGLRSIWKKPLPSKAAIPAAEVTEYDSMSNKLVVEAWYDDNRGYTYVRDPINIETLDKLKDEEGFRVWPTGHREMMVNQIYKRDAMKPKTMGEILVYMTPFIALIMILTIFLIFYGKAVQPITTASQQTADKLIEMQKLSSDITIQQNNLFRNIVAYQRGEPLEQVIVSPELEAAT